MGVGTEEFRSLTWREFVALAESYKAARRRAEFYPAQVASLLYNINRGEKNPARDTEDFMLDEKPRGKRQQTPEQMRRMIEVLNESMGGTVAPKKAG